MTEILPWQLDAVEAVMRRCDLLSDYSAEKIVETLEQLGFTITRRKESREATPATQNFPRCEKASPVDRGMHCESWYWGNPEHACCLCGVRRSDPPKPNTQNQTPKRGPSADLVIHDEVPAAFFQRAAEEPTSPKCTIITAHDPHEFASQESRTVKHSCAGNRYSENHVKPEYRGKFPSETAQVWPCDRLVIHEPHENADGSRKCMGITNDEYIRHVMPALKPCPEFATHLPHGECPGKDSTEEDYLWILSREADTTAKLISSPEDLELPALERLSVWVAKNDVGRRRYGDSIVLVDFNSLAVRFKQFPNGESVIRTIGIMTAMYELCHLDGADCPRHYDEILKASGRG